MNTFQVRHITDKEFQYILSDSRLRLSLQIPDNETPTCNNRFYIIIYKNFKLLFSLDLLTTPSRSYEIHIGCPKDSIIASRVLCLGLMRWVFEEFDTDAKAIVTTCPEGKMANLARKLGFNQLSNNSKVLSFIYIKRA